MFQQNSYRISRYWRWLKTHYADTWRLADIAVVLLLWASGKFIIFVSGLVALYAIVKIFITLKRKYKKPLVITKRVLRLYTCSIILGLALIIPCILFLGSPFKMEFGNYTPACITLSLCFILTCLSWGVVILADIILMPIEKKINTAFINDAKRILTSMPDLKVIGITGSFGKTSTKHFLTSILSEKYEVLMTPGSYNTPLGVVRTIREMMKPYHQIFVCEMGAKQPGDIKEICDIVKPSFGILTAVGPMHLETFKTLEKVRKTKFELIDALPSFGTAIINNDFPAISQTHPQNIIPIRYGITSPDGCEYIVSKIEYTSNGTQFKVQGPGNFNMDVETRLLGEANISDLLAAIVMALSLGMSAEEIKYAVLSIKPVEHRLSLKVSPGDVTILDDAFNSNPVGSKMAMDVLRNFSCKGKKIVVTPGMIELGTEEFTLNKELGKHIGNSADIALIVGEYNREALIEGLLETGFPKENLYNPASFNEAQAILSSLLKSGDIILYENDLPDTFN